MIKFSCPKCGRTMKVRDELAGRAGKCGCGEIIRIPHLAENVVLGKPDEIPHPSVPTDQSVPRPSIIRPKQERVVKRTFFGIDIKRVVLIGGAAVLGLAILVSMILALSPSSPIGQTLRRQCNLITCRRNYQKRMQQTLLAQLITREFQQRRSQTHRQHRKPKMVEFENCSCDDSRASRRRRRR